MPKIIVTSRFIRAGNHSKLNNYVKYIATREGVELTEQNNVQQNIDREIFINYLGTRPNVVKQGTHGLFSDTDEPIVLDKAAKEVVQHNGTIWTHIVSLRRDDAERMGYNTLDMWRDLVRGHIGDIAEAQKISVQNIRWYAAFHNKDSHPHVHIVMYSVDPKEGYLTNAGIEKIRSAFANDIYRNELQNLYQQQTEMRNNIRNDTEQLMNSLVKDLQNTDEVNPTLQGLIIKLSEQLQRTKGKKIYGYLQPEVKTTVDLIVAELAKIPALQKMYALWCELEQQKYSTYTSAVPSFPSLEDNKAFKLIKNSVIRAVLNMDISPELEIPMPSIAPDEIDDTSDEPQENIATESYHMNWRGDYKTACSLMYDGDYENALALFQEEADKGNIPAMYNIAKMYQRGQLGEENIPKAQEYYARTLKGFLSLQASAGKMQPYVWYHIGKLYNLGYGTEQNHTEAFKWFQKAAIADNGFAQYSLGGLYHYGNGTEQDYEKVFEWYKKSADKHNAYACYEAAKMLRDDIGTEQNPEQSDKYFREAYRGFLKMDNKNADDRLLYRLGAMTLKGISCTAYPEKASEYFRRSAEMNNKYALCEYGKMLTEGDVVSRDAEKGIAMLKHSAELGHSVASYALGKIYLFGKGVERDTDLAREWLTISAEAGNEYAQHLLENMDRFYQTAVQNAEFTMLKAFGRLVSADYRRISRGQKYHTEHKLKTAIRRKKEALGIKESHTDYPNY